jgi:hypothetical protein
MKFRSGLAISLLLLFAGCGSVSDAEVDADPPSIDARSTIDSAIPIDAPPAIDGAVPDSGPDAAPCDGTAAFVFTGAVQTFDVPACATAITVDAFGAQGGTGDLAGGLGGRAKATIPVTGGETLFVFVGGMGGTYQDDGPGGFNGGGATMNLTGSSGASGSGGGGSDVRRVMADLSSRVVVAGGGGGGGWSNNAGTGGAGGGLLGADGNSTDTTKPPGKGGTQAAGGAAGWVLAPNYPNEPGTFGVGGTAYHDGAGNGGGGGGWYGGGTGGFGGGAGGSGFVASAGATNTMMEVGVNSGEGLIVITWGL